ncbi:unnamed protein product [Urochloa humidicola]
MEPIDRVRLYSRLKKPKDQGVTAASVAYSWIERRIQLLAARSTYEYEYMGTEDPGRMSPQELSESEIMACLQAMLPKVTNMPFIPQLYDAKHPPLQADVDKYYSWPPMPVDGPQGESPAHGPAAAAKARAPSSSEEIVSDIELGRGAKRPPPVDLMTCLPTAPRRPCAAACKIMILHRTQTPSISAAEEASPRYSFFLEE